MVSGPPCSTARRRGLVAALTASLLVLGGCAGRSAPPQDELVFALGAWPTNLDPRFAPDAYSDRIARLIYAPLARRAADGRVEPLLARSWEQPSPTTVVVQLRAGARFHDGTPVRAKDVVATYEAIRNPRTGSVKRVFLDAIDTIRAVDEETVEFRLLDPHAPFLQVLAGIGIAPAAAMPDDPTDPLASWTGSGAWIFDGSEIGQEIRLRRNPSWTLDPSTKTERIRFRVIPDATVRVLELVHGSVDMTWNDLPPHVVEWLAARDDLRVERSESTLVKYLAFNTRHPALSDVRVRRAIARAIDVAPIIEHKLRGQATAAGSFMHRDSWAWLPDAAPIAHAPESARQLLDEAGLLPGADGVRLRLSYRTSQDETAVAVARILRRQLARVGIDMEVHSNEWGVFFSDIKQGNYDLYTLTGVGISDPDWYTFLLHSKSHPPDGANRMLYASADMDRLLDQGRTELDPEARTLIYRDVQRLRRDDLPLLPLWYQHNVGVSGGNVQDWSIPPSGDFDHLGRAAKTGPR